MVSILFMKFLILIEKLKDKVFNKILRFIGKNKVFNNFLTKYADKGFIIFNH